METNKNRNSQIRNLPLNQARLQMLRKRREKPSAIYPSQKNQIIVTEKTPVVFIPDAIGTEALQGFLYRLRQLKTSSNTIITDPSIVQEPNSTVVPGPSIDKIPANAIKTSSRANLRKLMNSQSPVS